MSLQTKVVTKGRTKKYASMTSVVQLVYMMLGGSEQARDGASDALSALDLGFDDESDSEDEIESSSMSPKKSGRKAIGDKSRSPPNYSG